MKIEIWSDYACPYCYIDEIAKHGFLIDSGAEADKILNYIKKNDFIIKKIL